MEKQIRDIDEEETIIPTIQKSFYYDDDDISFRSSPADQHIVAAANVVGPSHSIDLDPQPKPNPNPGSQINMEEKSEFSQKIVLYKAAIKGDWQTAKSIFTKYSGSVTMKITKAGDTALHIAAGAKHVSFVENLVKLSSPLDLAAKNEKGDTALTFAATSGVVRIAEVMVAKNPNLPNIYGPRKPTPVLRAVVYKRKHMASFLYSNTNFKASHTSEQIMQLLIASIYVDFYDLALDIMINNPELVKKERENCVKALHILARKPSAIGRSVELCFWKKIINSGFKRIYNKALMQTLAHQIVKHLWKNVHENVQECDMPKYFEESSRLLHAAARVGNVEFLIVLIRSDPDLLWNVDSDAKSIFHVAVENRQESVFSLVHEIGGLKDFLVNYYDKTKKSNILHLAGKLAAPNHLTRVSGAALQMQRELLWFKEVEKMVESFHLQMKHPVPKRCQTDDEKDRFDHLTPGELFTKEHEKLLKEGEKWMKNTATSCMLVATLIATVVFGAVFTIPGGNDNTSGIPIFRQKSAFLVFVILDVAALVFSTISIITFLSILTSRYAEDEFLMWLPLKLVVGLVTLFLSITSMVAAFSAAFFIVYNETKVKTPWIITGVAVIPALWFFMFHFKLVMDIVDSSYLLRFSLRRCTRSLF